jgi:4,5-DOPA dioxygenase extradiol
MGLQRWGQALPTPRALLVVSAHWQRSPPALGTTVSRPLLYDFAGFPGELSRLRYPAPGALELAAEVEALLPVLHQPERPWDHGVWVPLLHLFPRAQVPLLQLSLPSQLSPRELVDTGRRLAPLRERGVLILGSGGMVHNLGQLDWSESATTPAWALEFEAWVRARLGEFDLAALSDYRRQAPGAQWAHPSEEHFLPLLVAAGAAAPGPHQVRYPVEGFEYGSLSRLSVQFG